MNSNRSNTFKTTILIKLKKNLHKILRMSLHCRDTYVFDLFVKTKYHCLLIKRTIQV